MFSKFFIILQLDFHKLTNILSDFRVFSQKVCCLQPFPLWDVNWVLITRTYTSSWITIAFLNLICMCYDFIDKLRFVLFLLLPQLKSFFFFSMLSKNFYFGNTSRYRLKAFFGGLLYYSWSPLWKFLAFV